ncbi:MAG: AAA family ATPase [Bacillota bacterium]|nr:AAA family ATPase [Bacillota bacterium]
MTISMNQKIYIKAHSQIYKDKYESKVIAINSSDLHVAMPYDMGRIVLLGVGTRIEVYDSQDNLLFHSIIREKNHSDLPYLKLDLPSGNIIEGKLKENKACRVIAITSGKGGVGKTNFTINLGIALSQLGYKTVIIDADLGTANVDVLMNIKPTFSLTDVINGQKEILDVIVEGPKGVLLIPGGSGIQTLANLSQDQLDYTATKLQQLEQFADFLLIDTGAGLNNSVVSFVLAADEVLVVTTPEPHAITDAYAIIKVMTEQDKEINPNLIINRAETKEEATAVAHRIQNVVKRFLNLEMTYLGYIIDDPHVLKSVKATTPVYIKFPFAPASKCINSIALNITNTQPKLSASKSFFHKIKRLFS